MATPVVLTTGARPITAVESGGVPMTPVDTLGEPVTVVDALGEPVVLINNDGTPAFLAYSAKTYLGGVAPYHWLDFINNRALYASNDVGGVSSAPGYSFSRASAGYYTNLDGTLTSFASGALRRGDRGVLIEGARTNLLLQSQTFDNASWTKTNATVTANAAVAPDGTTTADKIIADAANATHYVHQSVSLAGATTYTFSAHVRAGEYGYAVIITGASGGAGLSARTAVVNLSTGALESETVGGMTKIIALANGWYYVSVTTAQTSGVGSPVFLVQAQNTTSASAFLGDGTSGIYVWGAQLEAASYPSSYIPTTTASATRAADVLTYTAGVSYPASLWCEFEMPVNALSSQALLQLDAGSTNDRQLIYVATSARTIVDAASATQAFLSVTGTVAANTTTKLAGRTATNSVQVARGGTLGTEDTLVTQPATPTRLLVGIETTAGGSAAFGYIRRAAVFNSALTDAQLQTVST